MAGGAWRGPWFVTAGGRGLLLQLSTPFSLHPAVLPGPGAALGAGHHGTGAAGERAGHLPPGRPALPPGLLPGQERRCLVLSVPSPGGGRGWELVPPPPQRGGRAPGVAYPGAFLQPPGDIRAVLSWVGLTASRSPASLSPHISGAVGLWGGGNLPLRTPSAAKH